MVLITFWAGMLWGGAVTRIPWWVNILVSFAVGIAASMVEDLLSPETRGAE